ncbi:hypothetical protein EB796_021764 [Bugula neritina]|uniref:Sulfotransferase domain-containing protein n=1 Tax=Bugula neritina TaxID=10212 RepID=A0A7J7J2N5_BUGNE|nr:hypothetical protein EB796_021764 [Bugula neritina]
MKTSKGTTSSASDNVAVQEKLQHIIDRRDQMYRKGKIGDWKNHLTVVENEMFDEVLAKWPPSKEIPFVYEVQ